MTSRRYIWWTLPLLALLLVGVAALDVSAASEITTELDSFATQAGFGGTGDIRLIIARLLRTVLSLAGIVLLVMIVYGGVLWLTAKGEQEKIQTAQRTIVQAIVGLLIVLSAFAIVQFVVRSLISATGGTPYSTNDPRGPGGYLSCPTCPVDVSASFVVESWGCFEQTTTVPQNALVQILFNHPVPTGNLEDFFTVSPVGGDPAKAIITGSGNTVSIHGVELCPSGADNCFAADTSFEVDISPSFESADGQPVDCTLLRPCTYTFKTTSDEDREAPEVTLTQPEEGDNVFPFTPVALQSSAKTTELAIGLAAFTVDGNVVDTSGAATCSGTSDDAVCVSSGSWSTAAIAPGQKYELTAEVSDCAGNVGVSPTILVQALAGHCGSGTQDADETGVDCGGADCESCVGSSCTDSSSCASMACVANVCVSMPRIDGVDRSNGAVGNFVTIRGMGFGSSVGSVVFLGSATTTADDVVASVVSCPNPSWNNTQVVVAVPTGAVDGPVSLTTAATSGSPAQTDTTGNTFGPAFDFDVNTTARPGVCSVVPVGHLPGSRISITGVNFGTDASAGDVYWAGANTYAADILSTDTWSNTFIEVSVPPSLPGSYNLSVFVGSEGSNTVASTILAATAAVGGPVISEINSGVRLCQGNIETEDDLCAVDADCGTNGTCVDASTTAGPGQYVTITGSNFGTSMGTVLFGQPVTGDTTFVPSFPAQCSTNWWSDSLIVVQVPTTLTTALDENNPKTIRVRRQDYPTTAESNTKELTVRSVGVTPGLCALSPTAGPVGTAVSLYGSNLGSGTASFEVRYHDNIPATVESYTSASQIGATVPVGAQSGQVTATVSNPVALQTNALNFSVGSCIDTPTLCTTAQVCCSNGSCAANAASCPSVTGPNAQYAYHFSTGPIPNYPTVIQACNDQIISPTPSTLLDGGTEACVNSVVGVSFAPGAPATTMDVASINASSVMVQRCVGTGVDPCEALEEDPDTEAPVYLSGGFTYTPAAFTFDPDVNLAPDTWYRVVLQNTIQNELGIALQQPLAFRFKTRIDPTPCTISEVYVTPSAYTAVTDASIPYSATPVFGSCLLLDPDDYLFNWSLVNNGKNIHFDESYTVVPPAEVLTESTELAEDIDSTLLSLNADLVAEAEALLAYPEASTVTLQSLLDQATTSLVGPLSYIASIRAAVSAIVEALEEADEPEAPEDLVETFSSYADTLSEYEATLEDLQPVMVLPYEETNPGQPATVTAAEVESSVSDTEELVVNFSSPSIVSMSPTCTTACVNAQVGATFSTAMQATGENGLLGSHIIDPATDLSQSNIALFTCSNEFCSGSASIVSAPVNFVNDPARNDDGRSFSMPTSLLPSTYYRVRIWGGVESEGGQPLWGDTNAAGEPLVPLNDGDYFSWIFRTRDDSSPCGIGSVSLAPLSMILEFIGARGAFSGNAVGVPDSCTLAGQPLNASFYPWQFSVAPVESDNHLYDVAEFLPLYGRNATLDTHRPLPIGCSEQCLNIGSQVYGAVCGNNVVEPGEDCDPPNALSCTTSCLTIGVSACSATLTTNCCGNGAREGREECDDDENVAGDGCSPGCLNEGSAAANLTCGDGIVSHLNTVGGEECEDGNTDSGDGCSSVCLREGSINITAVAARCGNSVIEPGEDCDDGDIDGGDGCSSNCLSEPVGPGPWAFGSLSGVCGIGGGGRQYSAATGVGEECDDGNNTNGDGCSSRCQKEGSSISPSVSSFCGDATLAASEECEVAVSIVDSVGPVDSVQPLEIDEEAVLVVENGVAQATVSAGASDSATSTSAVGSATVGVSCSCETDAQCGNLTTIGCGLNGCCMQRPEVNASESLPLDGASGLCRNTLVELEFTERMDPTSFFTGSDATDPEAFVQYVGVDSDGDGVADPAEISAGVPSCPATYEAISSLNFWQRVWQFVARPFMDVYAASVTTCRVPAQLSFALVNVGTPDAPDMVTRVTVGNTELLEPNGIYRVVVHADSNLTDGTREGVESVWQVTMRGPSSNIAGFSRAWASTFTTGNEICEVEEVIIEDSSGSPGVFTQAQEAHQLTARAFTIRSSVYEPIAKVPGVYAWSWGGTTPTTTWGWTTSVSTPDVVVFAPDSISESNVSSLATLTTATPAINGEETVTAQLRITEDTVGISSVDAMFSGTLDATVFLCENPWPMVGAFPFVDSVAYAATVAANPALASLVDIGAPYTNFSFYYCRDDGAEANTTDDLPALRVAQVDAADIQSEGVFKELLFIAEGEGKQDAMGVRVAGNETYAAPAEWFADRGFVGSPAPEALAGFEGVRDGRTLYVSAPNLSGGALYPNVYAVAYNQGASADLQEIYQAALENWSFMEQENVFTGASEVSNARMCSTWGVSAGGPLEPDPVEVDGVPVACTSDLDCLSVSAVDTHGNPVPAFCDATKDKLARDVKRLVHVKTIMSEVESYGATHRHCSVTKNQQCLSDDDCSGSEVCVASVPTLTQGSYIPSKSLSTWPSWQAQLGNALATALPVDPLNRYPSCPEGYDAATCYDPVNAVATCPSGSFVYEYQSIALEEYVLRADLEYGPDDGVWYWAYPVDADGPNPPYGANVATLYLGSANVAPGGYYTSLTPSLPVTPANGGIQSGPNCTGATFTAANVCGDGLLGSGEVCEVGATSTVPCTVPATASTPAYPGIKVVSCIAPPAVDACGRFETVTESTAACLPMTCGNGVVDGAGEVCDDGAYNGQYGFCGTDCTWSTSTALYCGDGSIGGSEVCDCGNSVSTNPASVATCHTSTSTPILNGQYFPDAALGCAVDCSGSTDSCGDGLVNGSSETCDGEVEQWGGKLCANGDPCTTNTDCSDASICGAGSAYTNTCGPDAEGYPQVRTRICTGLTSGPSYAGSCQWPISSFAPGGWGACQSAGSCGNGVREGTEACDDGDTDNLDTCTNACESNVCGDGFRNIGIEACDLGTQNGVPCDPAYSATCNFCTTACTYQTVTGGFCGNDIVDGGEYCDGNSLPSRCYRKDVDPALRQIGGSCVTAADCINTTDTDTTNDNVADWVCSAEVGICDGGTLGEAPNLTVYNGLPCIPYTGPFSANAAYACGNGNAGLCRAQQCNDNCQASCPYTYAEAGVLVQSETASTFSTNADLYTYGGAPSPDQATFQFPVCRAGVGISADINIQNMSRKPLDIVFLIDASGSMALAHNGSVTTVPSASRIEIGKTVVSNAINNIIESLQPGIANIALVKTELSDYPDSSDGNPPPEGLPVPDDRAEIVRDFTDNLAELQTGIDEITYVPGAMTAYADALYLIENMFQGRPIGNQRVLVVLGAGYLSSLSYEYQTGTLNPPLPAGINGFDEASLASQSLEDDEFVEIYTLGMTTAGGPAAIMRHFSNDACNDDEADEEGCAPNANGIEYWYQSTNADTAAAGMDAIIQSAVLGMNLTYVHPDLPSGGTIAEGLNVSIPMPEAFNCPASGNQTLPFRVIFPGTGTINIGNVRLDYCPL